MLRFNLRQLTAQADAHHEYLQLEAQTVFLCLTQLAFSLLTPIFHTLTVSPQQVSPRRPKSTRRTNLLPLRLRWM